ncbi:hypothetical protein G3446_25300 [Thiorhodococcus minor]|uniref:Uncharacterized protein n=1 Tax=Thiorhodococcus minor TaxID=57489 RepID=A0A6M0K779_9GAMM|nr:hypothetical protein [Thiorhodococcus minor]
MGNDMIYSRRMETAKRGERPAAPRTAMSEEPPMPDGWDADVLRSPPLAGQTEQSKKLVSERSMQAQLLRNIPFIIQHVV